jgi:hypothetical protein
VAREIGALINDVAIPVQTKPFEALENRAGAVVSAARLVGILDSKQKLAAEFSRIEPVEECRARASDVEVPRWRGGESESGFGRDCQAAFPVGLEKNKV